MTDKGKPKEVRGGSMIMSSGDACWLDLCRAAFVGFWARPREKHLCKGSKAHRMIRVRILIMPLGQNSAHVKMQSK